MEADGLGEGVGLAGLEEDGVVEGVCGFDAEHGGPLVVAEVGHGGGFAVPGVPDDGGGGAFGADVDASVEAGVEQADGAGEAGVDAVGVFGDSEGGFLLGEGLGVAGFVDVGAALEAVDGDVANVVDGEVGVERLGEGQGGLAEIVDAEADVQGAEAWTGEAGGEGAAPGLFEGAVLRGVAVELGLDRDSVVLGADVDQGPAVDSCEAMGGPVGPVWMGSEPWPAEGYSAADGAVGVPVAGITEPEDREGVFGLPCGDGCAVEIEFEDGVFDVGLWDQEAKAGEACVGEIEAGEQIWV